MDKTCNIGLFKSRGSSGRNHEMREEIREAEVIDRVLLLVKSVNYDSKLPPHHTDHASIRPQRTILLSCSTTDISNSGIVANSS